MAGEEAPRGEDEPLAVTEALVHEIADALDSGDLVLAAALTEPLHAADLADVLEQLDSEGRLELVRALGPAFEPEALTYLDEFVRDELLIGLGPSLAGKAVAELETDDAIEVLSELDEGDRAAILAQLKPVDRIAIEEQLAYPEYSAGRLMQREIVAVSERWTVGLAIDYLRAVSELPDSFYQLYLVDPQSRLTGMVTLSQLVRSRRTVQLAEIKAEELRRISPSTEQEEVAFMFRQYSLVEAPVTSEDGRLLGVITVDDVVDVMEEEAEDDIMRLGGVGETDLFASPWRSGLNRLPWLAINLLTAILASLVIAQFGSSIEKVVALAVLMPIVASMGGNAGTQTLTIAVRSLAVKELTAANLSRVLTKELVVGLLNGLAFLAIGVLLAIVWFGDWTLAAVFGAAMLINLVAAALAGLAVPVILDRLELDPAISSGVFVTTVTDVVGFFAFLGLATYFLL